MITTAATPPRLALDGVSKSFGGIQALVDVSLEVAAGEVHAILGENGAGKSTAVKIITGIQTADFGEIRLDGAPVIYSSPLAARDAGIVAVYQDPKLFPHLDVAENIFMGQHPTTRFGTVARRRMYQQADELLTQLDAEIDPHALVAGLSIGQAQYVEFARAFVAGADRLLILDEPTAALTPAETERLFRIVRSLRQRGTSVIFISHRLEELEGLVDTVTVLRDGRHVATRPASELTQDDVVRLMVGRTLARAGSEMCARPRSTGPPALRVEGLANKGVFEGVSFEVAAGEILGVAGLVGAGRSEIAQTIFGATPPTSGSVFVEGREIRPSDPRKMLAEGVAYLPEDRDGEGLVTRLAVQVNLNLAVTDRLASYGLVRTDREIASARHFVRELQIKVASLAQPVASLSGGNRQKVVIGKWLALNPKVLILDEPTHGIDVGTKAQVHQLIRELAAKGMAVVMISSDLPEVLAMSDRILVVSDGKITDVVARKEATQERIMHAASLRRAQVSAAARIPVAQSRPARPWAVWSLEHREFGIFTFLVLLAATFSLTSANFATLANANTIALNASILTVVACAETVVVLTRNFDLSVGSIVALASYLGLDLIRQYPAAGPIMFLAPVAIGGLCGAFNGLLVAVCRIPSVIATLGTLSIFRGLAYLYAGGRQINAQDLPRWVLGTASMRIAGVSLLVLVAFAVVVASAFLLRQLRIGRQIYAIGSNPEAAAFFGLNSRKVVFIAYVITGLLTGLGAFLFGTRAGYVVPYLAQGLELTALAAVVLGGVSVLGGSGTVVGAAIGAITLATLDNGLILLGAAEFTRQFIQGLAIVLAVVVDAVIQRRIKELLKSMRWRRA